MAKKKLVKIVIDRKKWLVPPSGAAYFDGGSLYDPGLGKMCCLGFAMRQVGHCSVNTIKDVAMPAEIKDQERAIAGLSSICKNGLRDSLFATRAARINDDLKINNKQREEKLVSLGKQHGFNFKFIN